MNHSTTVWLIVAAALIIVGAVIFTAILAKCDWDFTKLSTDDFQTKTYTSPSAVKNISIDANTTDIVFYATDEDSLSVVCRELVNAPHTVSFDNGNLTIDQDDYRKWFHHIGIHSRTPKIEIYLPCSELGALNIDVTTGDITIPANFTFDRVQIDTSTGDVAINADTVGALKVMVTTGDITVQGASCNSVELHTTTGDTHLSNVTCHTDMTVATSTGDVTLQNVHSKSITSTGTTGSANLTNVIVGQTLLIQRTTGDVKLKASDAKSINIRVTTGDVTGDLLTGKIFTAASSTGKVSVPENSSDGTCVISATTGDIKITAG